MKTGKSAMVLLMAVMAVGQAFGENFNSYIQFKKPAGAGAGHDVGTPAMLWGIENCAEITGGTHWFDCDFVIKKAGNSEPDETLLSLDKDGKLMVPVLKLERIITDVEEVTNPVSVLTTTNTDYIDMAPTRIIMEKKTSVYNSSDNSTDNTSVLTIMMPSFINTPKLTANEIGAGTLTADALTVDGDVGIGTTLPNFNLEVYDDSEPSEIGISSNESAVGSEVGFLKFEGKDDGTQRHLYASISSEIINSLDLQEEGQLSFNVSESVFPYPIPVMTLNHDNLYVKGGEQGNMHFQTNPHIIEGVQEGHHALVKVNNSVEGAHEYATLQYNVGNSKPNFFNSSFNGEVYAMGGRNNDDAKVPMVMEGDLTVNGTITTNSWKIAAAGAPDYVFEPDYDLKTLDEVEDFIGKNGHLPNVPSAAEVESGVDMVQFNFKLLEKIEELTLHTIEQEKKLKKMEALEQKLAVMEKMIARMAE